MAHFLRFDGVDDHVLMASTVTSPVSSNYELLRVVFSLNSLSANQCLVGHDGNNFIRVSESSVQVRYGSLDLNIPISPSFVTGQIYDLRITNDGSGISVTNDGVQIGYVSSSPRQLVVSMLGKLFNNSSYLNADVYLIDILGGTVVYNPSSSNGTGSVLPDSAGNNDGALVNFATDDSQWVYYDAPADTTPDQFTLTAQTGVSLSTYIESNTIVVTGVDAATDIPISITGGEYTVSTDSGTSFGAWTSSTSNVQLGHQVKVRVMSSAENETQVSATLEIGGVTSTFNVTTVALNSIAEITSSPATASPATTINYTVVNAGPITQARLTRGTAALTLGSVTNTSAVVPVLANNLPIIPFGAGAQLELWDGTEWLTAPIEFTQPLGQGVVTLAGTLNLTETGFLYNYGGTPEVGDQFVNTSSDLVLTPNGSISSDVDGTYTLYAIDVSDPQPVLEMFTIMLAEDESSEPDPDPDPVDPVDPDPVTGIGQISQSGLTNVINKSQPFVIHTGIRELTTGEALRGWVDNGGAHYWLTIHSYTVNDGMINTVTASVPSNTPSWGINQGTLTLQIVNLTGN